MDAIPPNAQLYVPILIQEYKTMWPDHPIPTTLPAQIEQETCASLTSKRCWNPRTENINPKNNSEYGFGLGQLTITSKFNNFELVKSYHKDLKDWTFEDRFNPKRQLLALLVFNKRGYDSIKGAATNIDHVAFSLAAYNGGGGGLLSDRRVCQATPKCNAGVWFGNVENTSNKSKSARAGYAKTFFQINREYVKNITKIRLVKYERFFKQEKLNV